jgi:YhcH/YjgK/YiaL family protein
MILDTLGETKLYEALHPRFKQAFDYLKQHDLTQAPVGKIVLDGDNLFISVAEMEGKEAQTARTETHQHYIDIQMPLSGSETIGWVAADDCKRVAQPYDVAKDIAFFEDRPTTYVILQPSQFAIFFPQDGHAPGIATGSLKKIIVKVRIAL